MTTWPCQVKECKIALEQSLVTGWLAILIINLFSNFLNPGWAEPCNKVDTFAERWQLLIVHAVLARILDFSYFEENALTGSDSF